METRSWWLTRCVLIALTLAAMAAAWRLSVVARTPWTGVSFLAASQPKSVLAFVEKSPGIAKIEFGSPAALAGLRNGERIVSVDGIDAAGIEALDERASRLRIGDSVVYTIAPGDRPSRTVTVRSISRLTRPILLTETVISFGSALVFVAIAALLLLKRSDDSRVRIFCLFSAAAAAFYLGELWHRQNALGAYSPRHAHFDLRIQPLLAALMFAVLLHFTRVFPRRHGSVRPLFIYLVPAFFALEMLPIPSITVGFGCMGLFGLFLLPALTVGSVSKAYRASTAEEKLQLRWPLYGISAAIFLFLLLGTGFAIVENTFKIGVGVRAAAEGRPVPAVGERVVPDFKEPERWAQTFALGAFVIIPITFAFGILKYRLLGIDRLIRNTTLYAILSLFILGIYLTLTLVVSRALTTMFRGVSDRELSPEWVSAGFTIVIAMMFQPVSRQVRELAGRRIFSRRFRFPTVLVRLEQSSRDSRSTDELLATYRDELTSLLGTSVLVLGNGNPAPRSGVAATTERSDACISVADPPDDVEGVLQPFLDEAVRRLQDGLERVAAEEQKFEIQQARRIQERLLPDPIPQPPGFSIAAAWKPSAVVGGDLFDVIEIDERRFAFCIGDVVGKGISAALLMSSLQASVRALASLQLAPSELCQQLHHVVRRNVAMGRFITFFYGEINTRTRSMRYASAGHVPPLLVSADGSLRELFTGGGALGVFSGMSFREESATLLPGDRIVCITDAVTEARLGDEDYGDERLRQVVLAARELPAREMLDAIIASVTAFSRGVLQDDLTVLVVEVLEPQ